MEEKLIYPSASRNGEAIFNCLGQYLSAGTSVLEIASGSGQHITGLARQFSTITWQPSDPAAKARASIAAWASEAAVTNLLPPLNLDVIAKQWWTAAKGPFDALMAVNLLHIAPWRACLGLLEGAEHLLSSGGFLYLYGPYKIEGEPWAPSNEAFDRSLRARNPQWGIRSKADVVEAAADHDLKLIGAIPMPANNLSLIFRKE